MFTDTGIAGLTLGGGYGWLNGKWGLACDNVLSADVVTADGQLVTAPAEENDDMDANPTLLGDRAQDRIRSAYGPNYDRLVALKAKYDPTNFFHVNANITPAVAGV